MKITMDKLSFNYHGDVLEYTWFWSKEASSNPYYSTKYSFACNSLKAYWFHVGQLSAKEEKVISKVSGFFIREVIESWVKNNLRFGHYVVLHDIDIQNKSNDFWNRIPNKEKLELMKDVVVLKCKDLKEVVSLCDSISTDFACAEGINSGQIVYWNEDHRKLEDYPPTNFKDSHE